MTSVYICIFEDDRFFVVNFTSIIDNTTKLNQKLLTSELN